MTSPSPVQRTSLRPRISIFCFLISLSKFSSFPSLFIVLTFQVPIFKVGTSFFFFFFTPPSLEFNSHGNTANVSTRRSERGHILSPENFIKGPAMFLESGFSRVTRMDNVVVNPGLATSQRISRYHGCHDRLLLSEL
uniref:Uncharacterized protein n=1 Tax=Cacopsylla melanoneura TaxID=428564 RepID=A0A8D8ZMC4_9HEMI